MTNSKEIEAFEALEAILEMLAKKESQLIEMANELENLKLENQKLQSEQGKARLKIESVTVSETTQNRTILIIDHVKMFRINLANMLMANGYRIVGEIGSPEESVIIETLLLKAPSIITIDFQMPGLNCSQVVKRIKSTSPDAKIVIISAELSHESIYNLLKAGVNDFVTKPVQQSRLVSVLRSLYILPD